MPRSIEIPRLGMGPLAYSSGAASFVDAFTTVGNPVPGQYILGATDARDWTNPERLSSPAMVAGTQSTGGGLDDDSIAAVKSSFLAFPANQQVSITIFLDPTLVNTGFHEVECLLRVVMSTGVAQFYECNLSYGTGLGGGGDVSYQQIVKWNGALNNFTMLAETNTRHPVTGSIFTAKIVNNTISTYLDNNDGNGPLFIQSKDVSTDENSNPVGIYSGGQPGFGLFQAGDNINNKYGITRFSALAL